MVDLPDPEWYVDNVLVYARPGGPVRPVDGPAARWQAWWRQQAAVACEPLRTAAGQGFVLTADDLAALGVTRARSRNEQHQGRWTDAGHGAVAPLDIREASTSYDATMLQQRRTHALECAGAALRRPAAAVSGRSAATLHGLPTMRIPPQPELTDVRAVGQGPRAGTHVFGAALDTAETTQWFGVAVETVARTLVTLARHGRRDAVMAADAALRESLVDRVGIAAALSTAVGWPWVRQARSVLALADPRAESPLESITRLALHDDGFPEPELQAWLGTDRVDFYWPAYGLVLEADGRGKYVDDAYWEEKKREQRLRPYVRRIERVVWSDIVYTWSATRLRLRDGLR